jgi:hypothetical protein
MPAGSLELNAKLAELKEMPDIRFTEDEDSPTGILTPDFGMYAENCFTVVAFFCDSLK